MRFKAKHLGQMLSECKATKDDLAGALMILLEDGAIEPTDVYGALRALLGLRHTQDEEKHLQAIMTRQFDEYKGG